MADSIGDVVRSLREAAGLTLGALAARAHVSLPTIGHLETGRRRPTPELIEACDRILGTAPLLTTLLELDGEGHAVRRRALLSTLGAATGLAGLDGASAVADLIRHGLLKEASEVEDWDAVVADYSRRLVVDPSVQYGAALTTQLMMVRQQLADRGHSPDRLRAASYLGHLYGLYEGNQGRVSRAHGWYNSSTVLADRSGDTQARVFVRARTASRAIFEGFTVGEVLDGAESALAISDRPSPGALEAHSARVHVYALTGDLRSGRSSIRDMITVAEALPDSPAGPIARTVSFRTYLESRAGSRADADRAWAEAEPILRPVPVWWLEARVYYGRALVHDGDVADGIAYALAACRQLPAGIRHIGLAVADLLSVVPATFKSDELDELRTFAATEPGPWETLAV
jgi:transcriptional regulator with XRE-family HTH domain